MSEAKEHEETGYNIKALKILHNRNIYSRKTPQQTRRRKKSLQSAGLKMTRKYDVSIEEVKTSKQEE